MDYLPYFQDQLQQLFPAHFIDVRREDGFDRVWIDGNATKYGVQHDLMYGVMTKFKVTPQQIATDIAARMKVVIETERSL